MLHLILYAAQRYIDSIIILMQYPTHSCVSRRTRPVSIPFKNTTRGEIAHQVIDSTGLKVFGEGNGR